jgi:hypothetical protein
LKNFQDVKADYVSALELASWLGLDEMAISRLGKSGVLLRIEDPANKRGYLYELEENVRRYIAHLRGPSLKAQEAFILERAKTEKYKAQKLRIEVAVRNGGLVPSDKLYQEHAGKLALFKQRLSAIPARVSGSVAESETARRELEAVLAAEINSSLSVLADILTGSNGQENSHSRG